MEHSVRYRSQARSVDWHITHKHSKEMAAKSHVVRWFIAHLLSVFPLHIHVNLMI